MKKKKILHGFVNYGTQSGVLSKTLREKGFDSISITYHDSYNRTTDIQINNSVGYWEKIINRPIRLFKRIKWFVKFDVFHFYFGASLLPFHIDFYIYRFFNKKIVCHYLGNDVQGYWKSVNKYKWTNMPGFMGSKDPNRYDKKIEQRLKIETEKADLQIVCAPNYSEFVPNSKVLPLALDLKQFKFNPKPTSKLPIIMHAPTNRGFKGTGYIQSAVDKLKNEGYNFDFRLIENVTHEDLRKNYMDCDLFIDQIMIGWYGTAAIEAMAIGRPVICSIRESYFKHIDYGEKIPIIHADPDCIYEVLKNCLDNKSKWLEIGQESRRFVEQVHDAKVVVDKLISYYNMSGICAE